MNRFTCCFGNWRGSPATSGGGSNAEVRAIEPPVGSDAGVQTDRRHPNRYGTIYRTIGPSSPPNPLVQTVEQPSTSNPPDALQAIPENVPIGGNYTYEELFEVMIRPADFTDPRLLRSDDEVFFVTLRNQNVAIKSHESQGYDPRVFDIEVSSLRRADHPNLMKVIGHCIKWDGRFVVYESLKLDSLDRYLFDTDKEPLDWNTRMRIALGSAKGLEYLHTTMDPPVIHRNMKIENVFLDDGFEPKLFDFGLPKKAYEWWNRSRPFGIVGWVAPEYVETGQLTLESDVYSFGVLLLVILTGREAYDEKKRRDRSLAVWARSRWEDQKEDLKDQKNCLKDIVDARMNRMYPKEMTYAYFKLALSCIDLNPSRRPDMSSVCRQLLCIASLPYDDPAESSHAAEMRPASPSASTS